jgi:hypothetical protein
MYARQRMWRKVDDALADGFDPNTATRSGDHLLSIAAFHGSRTMVGGSVGSRYTQRLTRSRPPPPDDRPPLPTCCGGGTDHTYQGVHAKH